MASKNHEIWLAKRNGVFKLDFVYNTACHPNCDTCDKAFTPKFQEGCTSCKSGAVAAGEFCRGTMPDPPIGKLTGALVITEKSTYVSPTKYADTTTSSTKITSSTSTSSSSNMGLYIFIFVIVAVVFITIVVFGIMGCLKAAKVATKVVRNAITEDDRKDEEMSNSKIMPVKSKYPVNYNMNPGVPPPMMGNPNFRPMGPPPPHMMANPNFGRPNGMNFPMANQNPNAFHPSYMNNGNQMNPENLNPPMM